MGESAAIAATIRGFRVNPTDTPKGAVVLLSDTSGVTLEVETLTTAFAAKGYATIALDIPRASETGSNEATADAAGVSTGAPDARTEVFAEIQAAVDSMKDFGKVAVVGYCEGGDLAYAAANRVTGIACVVAYAGRETLGDFREKRRAPTMLHFAESDSSTSGETITQFRAHRPDVSAFAYPAASGFFATGRDAFQPDAAEKAQERTLFWISQYVEGQQPILLKNSGSYAQAKTDKKKKKKDDDMGPPLD